MRVAPSMFLCVGCISGAVATLAYPVWVPILSGLLGLITILAAYMIKMGCDNEG